MRLIYALMLLGVGGGRFDEGGGIDTCFGGIAGGELGSQRAEHCDRQQGGSWQHLVIMLNLVQIRAYGNRR